MQSSSSRRIVSRPFSGSIRMTLVLCAAAMSIGWSHATIRHVSWATVDFFPPDLERQVRKHHRRFDAGIKRGVESPPSWRAGQPGVLDKALDAQVQLCAEALRKPVPLGDLVEELGVLAVRVADANDPLAVVHTDPREPRYSGDFQRYADTMVARVRLVYYGPDAELRGPDDMAAMIRRTMDRSGSLYPYVGMEFFRTGKLQSWRDFDDRSIAFGVTAVSLSRGLTDLANLSAFIWRQGGGFVPPPRPTPEGHVGATITIRALEGGFPNRKTSAGNPAMSGTGLVLPPP